MARHKEAGNTRRGRLAGMRAVNAGNRDRWMPSDPFFFNPWSASGHNRSMVSRESATGPKGATEP